MRSPVLSVPLLTLALWSCGSDHDAPLSTVPEAAPRIVAMSPAPANSFVASGQAFAVVFSAPMEPGSAGAAYQVMMGGVPLAWHLHA